MPIKVSKVSNGVKKIVLTKDPQYIGDVYGTKRIIQIQNTNNKRYGQWKLKMSKGPSKYFPNLEKLLKFREKSAALGKKAAGRKNAQAALKNKPAYDAINKWTERWITKNAPKYNANEFGKFENDLKKSWEQESKNQLYKGVIKSKNGFPNVGTQVSKVADSFSMYNLKPLYGTIHNKREGSEHRNFFYKIFMKIN